MILRRSANRRLSRGAESTKRTQRNNLSGFLLYEGAASRHGHGQWHAVTIKARPTVT